MLSFLVAKLVKVSTGFISFLVGFIFKLTKRPSEA